MKARTLIAMAASAVLLSATLMAAEEKLEGVKCVVQAKKAAKADNSVEYKGGKVFFCCKGCPKAFAKNPEKFATRANAQLVATGQAEQAKCPITGRDLNPDTTIEVQGAEVTFCCNGCKGKVLKAEGEEQLALCFSEKAFEKGEFEVKKAE